MRYGGQPAFRNLVTYLGVSSQAFSDFARFKDAN